MHTCFMIPPQAKSREIHLLRNTGTRDAMHEAQPIPRQTRTEKKEKTAKTGRGKLGRSGRCLLVHLQVGCPRHAWNFCNQSRVEKSKGTSRTKQGGEKNGKKRSFTFHIGVCQKILALDRCAACLLSGAPPALRFVADCQLDRSHHGWCNL